MTFSFIRCQLLEKNFRHYKQILLMCTVALDKNEAQIFF